MSYIDVVVRYFIAHYPYPNDLSKTRLTKMVYLADWKAVSTLGRQVTPIRWYFDHYGPYVPDVFDAIKDDPTLSIRRSQSGFGGFKEIVVSKGEKNLDTSLLRPDDQPILDAVIQATQDMSYSGFIAYVCQTEPIATGKRYTELPLEEIAPNPRSFRYTPLNTGSG